MTSKQSCFSPWKVGIYLHIHVTTECNTRWEAILKLLKPPFITFNSERCLELLFLSFKEIIVLLEFYIQAIKIIDLHNICVRCLKSDYHSPFVSLGSECSICTTFENCYTHAIYSDCHFLAEKGYLFNFILSNSNHINDSKSLLHFCRFSCIYSRKHGLQLYPLFMNFHLTLKTCCWPTYFVTKLKYISCKLL